MYVCTHRIGPPGCILQGNLPPATHLGCSHCVFCRHGSGRCMLGIFAQGNDMGLEPLVDQGFYFTDGDKAICREQRKPQSNMDAKFTDIFLYLSLVRGIRSPVSPLAISISILCTEAPTARRRAAQARAGSPAAISSNPEGGCGNMREHEAA